MQVALKIWRYNSETGDRELREYEIDAPEEATLLDVLDLIKDRQDGTLAYRKSCRMMICGSCGMRLDGAAVLACQTRMADYADAGLAPVVSAMGNLPIVKDLVVDMAPFWDKFRAMKPYLQPGYEQPADGKEYVIPQEPQIIMRQLLRYASVPSCLSLTMSRQSRSVASSGASNSYSRSCRSPLSRS